MNGVDVQVFVGIQVTKADFWEPSGSKVQCHRGHPRIDPMHDYCPQCGNQFKEAATYRPTKSFEKYAKSRNQDPHDLWKAMNSATLNKEKLGIYDVPFQGDPSYFSHMKDYQDFTILGVKIRNANLGSNLRSDDINPRNSLSRGDSLEYLGVMAKAVEAVAKVLLPKDRIDIRVYIAAREADNDRLMGDDFGFR